MCSSTIPLLGRSNLVRRYFFCVEKTCVLTSRDVGGYSPLVTSLPDSPVLEGGPTTAQPTRSLLRDYQNSLYIHSEIKSGEMLLSHSIYGDLST